MKKFLLNPWISYVFLGGGLLLLSNGYMNGAKPDATTAFAAFALLAIGAVLLSLFRR